MSARFDRGPAWAFVGEALVALVAADASEQVVGQFRALSLVRSVSTAQVVEALSTTGIGSLPSLGIIVRELDGYHLIVRGSARIGVSSGVGAEWVTAPRATSWSEAFRAEGNGFTLELEECNGGNEANSGAPAYWCDAGVLAVSRVVVDAQHFRAGDPASPDLRFERDIAAPAREATAEPRVERAAATESGSTEEELTASYLRRLIEETRDRSPEAEEAPSAGEIVEEVMTDARATEPGVTHTLDFEAVSATQSAEFAQDGAAEGALPPSIETPSKSIPGLISAVPGASAPLPAHEAPRPDQVGFLGDHDGHTVTVETLRAARAADGAVGTTIQAVHCPAIHPNPPHAEHCRRCGAVIRDHTITVITRPTLGELRFENGDAYPVDRPMLIGRRPSSARDVSVGGEVARLVTLDDPLNVLSKVHLEVRVEDWQVLVVDRYSTNHTIVTLPERTPMQLHPGSAVQIVPGTLIDLGGVTTARYDVEG